MVGPGDGVHRCIVRSTRASQRKGAEPGSHAAYDAGGVTPARAWEGASVVTTANRWLTMLVVLLVLAAGLGRRADLADPRRSRRRRHQEQRYGAVLAAADREVTAFVNLRYDRAAESVDAVAAGRDRRVPRPLRRSARKVIRVLQRHRSLMTGRVVWSGVSAVSPERATVIVATTGTVSNTSTDGAARPRDFRFRVSLVHVGGQWLTSDIQFVGDTP